MRLLFFHSAPPWTGAARAFAAAARGLAARGHQITFVCPPDSPVEQRLDYAAYEVLPMLADGAWQMAAWRLRRALALRFTEVAFVHTEREQLIVAAAARLAGRAAVVRRIGAGERPSAGRRTELARHLALTAWVFTLDEQLEGVPLPRTRIAPTVAPLGVDVAAYDAVRAAARPALGPGGADRVIVCLYDPTSRVRAAVVLRTVALLAPLHHDLGLAFVGPGCDDEDLRMHAAALGITKRVSFLGERDDYLSLVRAADLGWVVTRGDNAAYGCLDLLASRVPVLAERSAIAQAYVADGITGLLLNPNDPPGTAAAVARLLGHEEERAAMGNAGRARVAREFTEEAMVSAFESVALAAADRSLWRG